jgi:hypothetical protein
MKLLKLISASGGRFPRASGKPPQSLCSLRGLPCLAFPPESPPFASINGDSWKYTKIQKKAKEYFLSFTL